MLARKNKKDTKFAEHSSLLTSPVPIKVGFEGTTSHHDDSILIGEDGLNTENDTRPTTSNQKHYVDSNLWNYRPVVTKHQSQN